MAKAGRQRGPVEYRHVAIIELTVGMPRRPMRIFIIVIMSEFKVDPSAISK